MKDARMITVSLRQLEPYVAALFSALPPEPKAEDGGPGARFYDEVVRTLRRLGPQRFKVSIFTISIQDLPADSAYLILGWDLGHLGVVGRLSSERVAILFFGPRETGDSGDARLEADMAMRLRTLLRGSGLDSPAGRRIELIATHIWLDEILHLEDLVVA